MILQVLLFALYLVLPRLGPDWPAAGRWPALIGGLGLLLGGAGLLGAGLLALGRYLTPLPAPRPDGQLVERGPYRLVRHPIYGGLILGALGLALVTAHLPRLGLALLLCVFFDRKANREEHWLTQHYPHYAHYRTRVRKLIPWLY